jgi:adenylate cyclase
MDGVFTAQKGRWHQPTVALIPMMATSAGSISAAPGSADAVMLHGLDALTWECSAMIEAHGWLSMASGLQPIMASEAMMDADYVIRMRVISAPPFARMSVAITSAHLETGTQTFTRQTEEHARIEDISIALAASVGAAIAHSESERAMRGVNIGAHQLVTAGRRLMSGFVQGNVKRAFEFFNLAAAIDPDYPYLLASLGRAHAILWRYGWSLGDVNHIEKARELAMKAARHAPDNPWVQAELGFVKLWSNEITDSVWHYEQSMEALPFHPELAADAGMVLGYAGRNDEAIRILERSVINLSHDPDYRLWSLGEAYFNARDYGSAVRWLSRMNDPSQAQRLLAASKARLGLDAAPHVREVLRQQPDFSVRRWVNIQPFENKSDVADFEEALLLAGLPE